MGAPFTLASIIGGYALENLRMCNFKKSSDSLDRAHLTFLGNTHLPESSDEVVLVDIVVILAFGNGLRFNSVCIALVVL